MPEGVAMTPDYRWRNPAEEQTGPADLVPPHPAARVLYISGPYSDPDPVHGISRNILQASEAALLAWREGWVALCPHKNSAGFEHAPGIPYETWIAGDLELVRRSDAICMLPRWTCSRGACTEYLLARELELPIYRFNPPFDLRRIQTNAILVYDALALEVTGDV